MSDSLSRRLYDTDKVQGLPSIAASLDMRSSACNVSPQQETGHTLQLQVTLAPLELFFVDLAARITLLQDLQHLAVVISR